MRALLVAALACCACATTAPRSPDVLLQTDREFAAEAQAHGMKAAFTHFAADDAWVLKAVSERGRAAVERTFTGTDQVDLRWEPQGGELAASGDVGFTWGTWTRRLKSKPEAPAATGRYLTTWRKTPDGYRWTADLGDEDAPPTPKAP